MADLRDAAVLDQLQDLWAADLEAGQDLVTIWSRSVGDDDDANLVFFCVRRGGPWSVPSRVGSRLMKM